MFAVGASPIVTGASNVSEVSVVSCYWLQVPQMHKAALPELREKVEVKDLSVIFVTAALDPSRCTTLGLSLIHI